MPTDAYPTRHALPHLNLQSLATFKPARRWHYTLTCIFYNHSRLTVQSSTRATSAPAGGEAAQGHMPRLALPHSLPHQRPAASMSLRAMPAKGRPSHPPPPPFLLWASPPSSSRPHGGQATLALFPTSPIPHSRPNFGRHPQARCIFSSLHCPRF